MNFLDKIISLVLRSRMDYKLALSAAIVGFSLWKFKPAISLGPKKDYISELPDAILALIVSHTSMQDAYKMRVLSKRWRHLNVLSAHLNLDCLAMFSVHERFYHNCERYLRRYVEGVNQIVKEYPGQSICSFRVACCLTKKFACDVDQWISFAVRMGVEFLEIFGECYQIPINGSMPGNEKYAFSPQLLSEASTLWYLRLHGCTLKPNFVGQLLSLKVLVLSNLLLGQDEMQYIMSTCSNLEKLRLLSCSCSAKLSIDESFLQLKHLIVDFPIGLNELELSSDKLTTLEYTGEIIKFSLRVPNLENGYWTLPCVETDLWNDLARDVPQLLYLSVGGPVFLSPREPGAGSTFRNVIQLDFYLFEERSNNLLSVIFLLQACPLLQELRVMMSWKLDKRDKVKLPPSKPIHTKLKRIEIGGFYGNQTQMELIVYLLETAVALKCMTISSYFKHKWVFATGLYDGNVPFYTERPNRDTGEMRGEVEGEIPLYEGNCDWVVEELRGKIVSKSGQVIFL